MTPEIPPRAVPACPNASSVRGKLLALRAEPDGWGSVARISVESARDIDDLPNFARSKIGKEIDVFLHPQLDVTLSPGDNLKLKVTYKGDEKSGRFVLLDDDLKKI